MSIPCEQASNIVKIETTLEHVVALLEKHETREERMLDAIEVVAGQTEAIKYITENSHRHDKEIDELYHLIREHLETKPESSLTCTVLNSSYGKYILGAVFFGTCIDVYSHFDIVKIIVDFFK